MAASLARITGHVTHLERRTGSNERGPWAFTEATILVAGRSTSVITLADSLLHPQQGAEVDYLLEVSAGRGDNVRMKAVAEYEAA